jgi:hypothetical protein
MRLTCNPREPWNDPFLKVLISAPDPKFDALHCSTILLRRLDSVRKDEKKEVAVVSSERLSGHPYSGGYDSFRIADRIHACCGDAFILCVMRNQAEIIPSVYKQLIQEGYPGSLHDLLTSSHWSTAGFDLSFYEYDLLTAKYHALFGHDRNCILPYELMRSDLEAFCKRICDFLEIPETHGPFSTMIKNRSLPNRGLAILRLLNRFHRSELNPFPVVSLNTRVYKFLKRGLRRLFMYLPKKGSVFSEEQHAWITNYYKESNKRLKAKVGWTFSDFERKNERPFSTQKQNGLCNNNTRVGVRN